jgi:glycosyltransferase involved in cell wall biosynthesis
MKKTIVVSAINFFEGGPLSVLRDCLEYLSDNLSEQYVIVALVHDSTLLPTTNIKFIEFRNSRNNWFYRLYYEYVYFYFLSRRIKPLLWLSLHDITPNVIADIRVVYCHNASAFYPFTFRSLLISYKVALFSLFYRYLYRINLCKNNYVVVQQNCFRDAFCKMYHIRNVVVAYPESTWPLKASYKEEPRVKFCFLYPALPRVFKNMEVVAEAAKILHSKGRTDFEILFTLDGNENKYARYLATSYKNIPVISFIGLQSKQDVYKLYQEVDALIFPSKLETWGLPISEFKVYNKSILVADLPYAHETVGDYEKVKFFDPDDPRKLAEYMFAIINGDLVYDGNRAVKVKEPFAQNWEQLFNIILHLKVK